MKASCNRVRNLGILKAARKNDETNKGDQGRLCILEQNKRKALIESW